VRGFNVVGTKKKRGNGKNVSSPKERTPKYAWLTEECKQFVVCVVIAFTEIILATEMYNRKH
jgi:hypothetical protein